MKAGLLERMFIAFQIALPIESVLVNAVLVTCRACTRPMSRDMGSASRDKFLGYRNEGVMRLVDASIPIGLFNY